MKAYNGKEYRLLDGYNGDVIYHGNSKAEMIKAARLYDADCEGDWIPMATFRWNDQQKFMAIEIDF